ncbi:MAG TPA: hypothetical protein DEG17_26365 [Cyanobacteria bacterium UBA11149]|nr:hypothetical protein [Cyanobacteria bacterium UBA11367]HBE60587.1 hypothetical protein [Cyanobacteria bacterium UBA11366]HBK66949.1 hypothetical protein [Cyanobacteria bacterium UBA11166]HBR72743.1 hypothetical protein [Cyanobacteria bacterium UBA11159]HBS68858.1 hypothetical protein [Cyanobacteria bacterium UBA11153]HBW92293.1 hypothetical protein [Cyanobacteria bacterium UBA11149]HCA94601.1 hypothetical protein [Cyanobacteria bacterium UBA9226]
MYDLKSEDPEEPGVPDEYHNLQSQFLSRVFRSPLYPPHRVFSSGDLNLYYDLNHTQWYKRPDWFLVVGVSRLYEESELRSSYVVWQEGVNPFVVVEFLSPATEKEDLGQNISLSTKESSSIPTQDNGKQQSSSETPPVKWEVYEKILQVPYYIVFSRYTNVIRFFKLVGGRYQEQELDANNPRVWMPELEVGLGLWLGEYEGVTRLWLRWYDGAGNWIPTDTDLERQEKERERQEKEEALLQVERVQAQLSQVVLNLWQQGMTVEEVVKITGLSKAEVENAIANNY